MSRANIRIFTNPASVLERHSFLVANDQGGLSDQIGSVVIDPLRTTIRDLREMIEIVNDRGMIRRNRIYQEILSIGDVSPNPYKYSRRELRQYRFAVFSNAEDMVPTLIPRDVEDDLLVTEAVSNILEEDIIVVPQSQIPPGDDSKMAAAS